MPSATRRANVACVTEVTAARTVLIDSFKRIRDLVVDLTDGLTADHATYRPNDQANTIAWLLWHTARVQDDHVADLTGTAQVWERWRDRFGLPFAPDATGYGQSAEEVGQLKADGERLAGYHAEVHRVTLDYLQTLTTEELDRVVDTRWDPPVTASVRLVSVIGDALQHLGQAAYVRGLVEHREAAWHDQRSADH